MIISRTFLAQFGLVFSTATELGGKFDLEIYCCDGAGGRQGLHFVFTLERKVDGTVFFQHIQQWGAADQHIPWLQISSSDFH